MTKTAHKETSSHSHKKTKKTRDFQQKVTEDKPKIQCEQNLSTTLLQYTVSTFPIIIVQTCATDPIQQPYVPEYTQN